MNKLSDQIHQINSVFVHLGATLPKHLTNNLFRHMSLFPDQKLTLIVDQDLEESLPNGIRIYRYEIEETDKEILDEMNKVSDFHFRDGFWKYTFLRLFAIEQFHETCPTDAILHIESDVILMPNFPWQKFEKLNQLAWLGVNDLSDVASLVFSPNARETKYLASGLREISKENPTTTDMFSLREFAVRNPSRHIYLPSLTNGNSRRFDIFDESAKFQLSNFHGYFDPLAIGMWNFGQDPKNLYGFRNRLHIDSSYDLNPSKSKYFFVDNRLFDDAGLNIYSLHVHSKFLPLFSKDWQHFLEKELRKARKNRKLTTFNPKAFVGAVTDRKIRDNFWLAIAYIPGINILRKFTFVEHVKDKVKNFLKIKM